MMHTCKSDLREFEWLDSGSVSSEPRLTCVIGLVRGVRDSFPLAFKTVDDEKSICCSDSFVIFPVNLKCLMK